MTQFMLTKHADCFSNDYNNAIPEHLKDDPVLCEDCSLPSCSELITADRIEWPVCGSLCFLSV